MEQSMNDAYRQLLVEHNKLKQAYTELEVEHAQCPVQKAKPKAPVSDPVEAEASGE